MEDKELATFESIGLINDKQLLDMKAMVAQSKAETSPEAQRERDMQLVQKGIGLGMSQIQRPVYRA